MGNSLNRNGDGDEEIKGNGSMHTNMMRMMHDDVFKKYKVLEVLGNGSVGFVAKAKIRSKKVGGTAIPMEKTCIPYVRKRSNDLTDMRATPVLYALKSIQVDRVSDQLKDELWNEIDILKRLVCFRIKEAAIPPYGSKTYPFFRICYFQDHPNIVRAYEVFKNKRQIYMVLELCDGGDLYARAPYSEQDSCTIVRQILSAINYLVRLVLMLFNRGVWCQHRCSNSVNFRSFF
jgi:serine/threonine protein kinase